MTCSMLITPSSTEAQETSPFKNRIFPQDQVHPENRPAHRTHPYGGTLVWGTVNKPTIINPILTQTSVSAALMGLIFDSLVRIDSKGTIIPGLAESWDISSDGLEYTFYLRKDVTFHDGTPLTAEDVLFTYQQVIDPQNKSPFRAQYESVKRFEAVEANIFKIVLKEPFSPLLSKLLLEIIPKHLLVNQGLNKAAFNYSPVGTGSFKFEKWDKKTNQIELIANPHYFKGRPYLDGVIIKTYPDNLKLWAAFMRREVDLIQWINRKDYFIVESDPAFKAHAIPGSTYYAIVYNLDDPIWRNRKLRQAIVYGIDIDRMIEALPQFGGIKSIGPFHPESEGYNEKVKPYVFNPIKASEILIELGWEDEGRGSGIRTKNGQELIMRMLIYERNDTFKKMAQIIRQQLAELGIKLVIIYYQDEEELTEEFMRKNEVQVWLRLFQGLGVDMGVASRSWYSSSSEFVKFGNYKNKKIDRLFELGSSAKNRNKRANIYKNIHKVIYKDQPACFLFFPTGYFGINSKFKNTDEYFNLYMPTYMMKDWYISKN